MINDDYIIKLKRNGHDFEHLNHIYKNIIFIESN